MNLRKRRIKDSETFINYTFNLNGHVIKCTVTDEETSYFVDNDETAVRKFGTVAEAFANMLSDVNAEFSFSPDVAETVTSSVNTMIPQQPPYAQGNVFQEDSLKDSIVKDGWFASLGTADKELEGWVDKYKDMKDKGSKEAKDLLEKINTRFKEEVTDNVNTLIKEIHKDFGNYTDQKIKDATEEEILKLLKGIDAKLNKCTSTASAPTSNDKELDEWVKTYKEEKSRKGVGDFLNKITARYQGMIKDDINDVEVDFEGKKIKAKKFKNMSEANEYIGKNPGSRVITYQDPENNVYVAK